MTNGVRPPEAADIRRYRRLQSESVQTCDGWMWLTDD